MPLDDLPADCLRDDTLDGVRLDALERGAWLPDLLRRGMADARRLRDGEPGALRAVERIRAEISERLAALPAGETRPAVLAFLLAAAREAQVAWYFGARVTPTLARTEGFGPSETAVLVRAALEYERSDGWFTDVTKFAARVAEGLPAEERAAADEWLRALQERVLADPAFAGGERSALVRRLERLLPERDPALLPEGMVPGRQWWAAPLRDRLAEAPTAGLAALVWHLAVFSGPRPPQKWRRECVRLVEAAKAGETLVACVREMAVEPEEVERGHGDYVDPAYKDLACGVLWAAALTAGAETAPHLERLAGLAGMFNRATWDGKLAGAAVNALGAVEDPAGLDALRELDARLRHKALRKQLDTAIETAAGRQGVTPRQLVESAVPDHGLAPGGTLTRTVAGHTVTLAVEDAVTVRLTYTAPDGTARRTAPPAVKDAPEVTEIKALAKRVRATLAAERRRVEALLSADPEWSHDEWARHYRDHPIVGVITRDLIWDFQDEAGEWRAALPADAPPAAAARTVRLWHPIHHTPDEIRAWRATVADRGIRQPFKQAFREIYLLTPAEEETAVYSNRFAAHIVHYNRFYALTKERGWQSNYLGRHHAGAFGQARGTFGDGGWRATFEHTPATEDFDWAPEHAATDRIVFERRAGKRWTEVPLGEVPPVVFSEAMRDADLFVGVTSIAADPGWVDRGDDRYTEYWRTATFGALTATAETRRAALERVLPRLRIAGRCELTDRFLKVRGDLRTYKIHLGSANILMEPDDSYLCIVQARGGTKVHLPFEDDRLSLILSKALLLAADTTITDETILRQIRRTVP
ncbi:hypothetical protein GCM10009678_69300 [Actinomadura kijaniata]|uniref:DUF4132 domain-containing protein n=1 Tax=Actinomadura namibiensis TaxID=182080 RepID=A0A7W3QM92_ACTNM|nr:DUF4132 domain-containing protein [Actinomadura namibiensis]MBA8952332.1 hypothetical protein [Actinomadura namibiensis]